MYFIITDYDFRFTFEITCLTCFFLLPDILAKITLNVSMNLKPFISNSNVKNYFSITLIAFCNFLKVSFLSFYCYCYFK